MKRVGILTESTKCSRYFYETISKLAECDNIELLFLQNRHSVSHQSSWERFKSERAAKGLLSILQKSLFNLFALFERRIMLLIAPAIKEHFAVADIEKFNHNESIHITPLFSDSGTVVRYSDLDIEKIRAADLDIIVIDGAPGILRGDILRVARDGIVSFYHGDNRWNRGALTAFWEVYFRKATTGFVIQILTEELAGGSVIFRGNFATRRSYTENLTDLYSESNPYLAKILLQYARSGTLPAAEEKYPFGGYALGTPSFAQLVVYVAKSGALLLSLLLERFVLRREKKWGVAYTVGPWRDANLRRGTRIKNPPGHFYADPFVISKNGRDICFIEDYSYEKKRACIIAVDIVSEEHYEMLGPVIEEPFHMSYPYLFEYEGSLYMVPETNEANAIRLYKCIDFPMKWEYQKDIFSDVRAFDSMIFEKDDKWWLLTNMSAAGREDGSSQLMIYYSESPVSGEWTAHAQNPVVFDSAVARNGGILDIESQSIIRSRQRQGFNTYGDALTLAKIRELTADSYHEEEVGEILPNFFDDISRCHHIYSNGNYTVYDYLTLES